ncbi:MAG: tetratricopeptide repeat protein [Bacteroidales bacterium]|nr:tetratricopeptide repeat protein [Bacteroidales bacterium]
MIIEKNEALFSSLASSYNDLGIIYSDIGDFKNSLYYYDLFEESSRDIQDTLLVSYALHNKAIIYLDWGEYDEALKLFLESKELVQAQGYEDELVASISSIATVYHEIEDYSKARYYYYQALELADKHKNIPTKAVILHNLGEILFNEAKYDSSLILLNTSLRYEMEEGNTLGIAESKSMIGTVNIALNKYNIAFIYFNEAETVFERFGSKQNLASLYLEYAKAHQKLENDSLSIYYFQKGIDFATKIDAKNIMLEGYKSASINYERLLDYQQALIYYRKSISMADSLFNEKATMRMDYMTVKLETQEREKVFDQLENDQKVLKLETKTRTIYLGSAIIILILVIVFFNWRYYMKKRSEQSLSKQYDILLESEQKIKALLDASFDSTLLVNLGGEILTINNNNLNGFFSDTQAMLGMKLFRYFSPTNQKILEKFFELVLESKSPKETHIHEENKTILNIKISPVLGLKSEIGSLAFYIKDITQLEKDKLVKEQMEKQLIQTQKMETVGTLAGGIAHDFNNSLATIQGYVSMSLEDVDKESHLHRYLINTQKAVNLSRETVKKLLTFSRTDEVIFDKIELDQLICDSIDIIKGSKPKNIRLEYPETESGIELLAEKNQLTQVILNICTNAFHAIDEKKGKVQISLEKINKHPSFNFKNIAIIRISDNGLGMDEETRKRIFEPFFTTKAVGKGTGLGLSVVSGIIKQHNGDIKVKSEIGKGTTFSLYLPIIS